MSKKSRRSLRRRTKSEAPIHEDGDTPHPTRKSSRIPSSSHVLARVSESSFKNVFGNEPKPADDWSREMKQAEQELGGAQASDCLMRATKAARATRQFDRLQQVIEKAELSGQQLRAPHFSNGKMIMPCTKTGSPLW